MHKENKALWKVKPLLTRLQGDHTWAPCSMMIQPNDLDLFADELFIQYTDRPLHAPSVIRPSTPVVNGTPTTKALPPATHGGHLPTTETAQPKGQDTENATATNKTQPDESSRTTGAPVDADKPKESHADQVRPTSLPPEMDKKTDGPHTNGAAHENHTKENGEVSKANPKPTSQRPAGAAPASDADVEMAEPPEPDLSRAAPPPPPSYQPTNPSRAASITTSAADDLYIHPLFLAPRSAHPDRDQGLPDQEAEDVRRLLQLYVQKQEEVCRGTKKLYEGLLRADRYRRTVIGWSKAEAHRGELSDGEDWYDREEWGLVEDLKKGHDEEEEETAQTQKKTRNRK